MLTFKNNKNFIFDEYCLFYLLIYFNILSLSSKIVSKQMVKKYTYISHKKSKSILLSGVNVIVVPYNPKYY